MLKPVSLIKDYYGQSIKWWTSTRSFQVKKTHLYCIGYNTLTSITLIEIDWSILHASDLYQLIFLISWHRKLQNSHRPKRYLFLFFNTKCIISINDQLIWTSISVVIPIYAKSFFFSTIFFLTFLKFIFKMYLPLEWNLKNFVRWWSSFKANAPSSWYTNKNTRFWRKTSLEVNILLTVLWIFCQETDKLILFI